MRRKGGSRRDAHRCPAQLGHARHQVRVTRVLVFAAAAAAQQHNATHKPII